MQNLFTYSFLFIIIISIVISIFSFNVAFDYKNLGINPEDIHISDLRFCLANSKKILYSELNFLN